MCYRDAKWSYVYLVSQILERFMVPLLDVDAGLGLSVL